MKQIFQHARDLSPYLLVELLLPGGTVIALAMWLYRHYFKRGEVDVRDSGKDAPDLGAADAGGACAGACA